MRASSCNVRLARRQGLWYAPELVEPGPIEELSHLYPRPQYGRGAGGAKASAVEVGGSCPGPWARAAAI